MCVVQQRIQARKYFHNDCMINLYNAVIYTYLMYCNHTWGSTYKTKNLEFANFTE